MWSMYTKQFSHPEQRSQDGAGETCRNSGPELVRAWRAAETALDRTKASECGCQMYRHLRSFSLMDKMELAERGFLVFGFK
ncbi:hypothetical protein H671_21745 [Cricetulus griseus]|uniref:Uncharacterized protein n=1 Tax=Cricetulus griseus TaxID=10029 RepID=A0A061HUT8_CRIGR|nr:hypothetical protein H671_21745 [Cricetulus griseus]